VALGVAVAASPWIEPLVDAAASTAITGPWALQLCLGGLVSLGGLVAHGRMGKLQHRAGRAEAERDRLREFEMRALMVRGAAHDLKNLCVPLVVASDLLAEDLGTDASEELGCYIQTAADHATALLDRLVRADVDGHYTPTRCVGNEQIRRLKPLLARSLERRGHTFTYDIGDAAQVCVDRLDLAQAVVNLVTNAGYVREAPVHVRVRDYVEDGRWCLDISDDAGGIPRAIVDRLFEEGATAREGGTGIGLALTRHLVERNEGTIEVDTDDVGTRFILRFPLHPQGRSA
jgi:signal transduction histidine kinase